MNYIECRWNKPRTFWGDERKATVWQFQILVSNKTNLGLIFWKYFVFCITDFQMSGQLQKELPYFRELCYDNYWLLKVKRVKNIHSFLHKFNNCCRKYSLEESIERRILLAKIKILFVMNSKMKLLWAEYTTYILHSQNQIWPERNACWTSFLTITKMLAFSGLPWLARPLRPRPCLVFAK